MSPDNTVGPLRVTIDVPIGTLIDVAARDRGHLCEEAIVSTAAFAVLARAHDHELKWALLADELRGAMRGHREEHEIDVALADLALRLVAGRRRAAGILHENLDEMLSSGEAQR
jgi:hypothetical protein